MMISPYHPANAVNDRFNSGDKQPRVHGAEQQFNKEEIEEYEPNVHTAIEISRLPPVESPDSTSICSKIAVPQRILGQTLANQLIHTSETIHRLSLQVLGGIVILYGIPGICAGLEGQAIPNSMRVSSVFCF